MGKVYDIDEGTKIRLDTGVDISAASNVEIRYEKEDGSTGTWEAVVEDTTKVVYTKDGTEEAGDYALQAWVELASWQGLGETVILTIYDSYK